MSLLMKRNSNANRRSLPSLFDGFFSEPFPFFPVANPYSLYEWGHTAGRFQPAVEVKETDSSYEIRAEVPGISKDDITIEVKDGMLILSGEKKNELEDKHDGYYRSEVRYGSFRREFRLGDGVKADDIRANYKQGMLEISIPKGEVEHRTVAIEEG